MDRQDGRMAGCLPGSNVVRQACKQAGGQTYRQAGSQKDIPMESQEDTQAGRLPACRQAGRKAGRHASRKTDRQTDGQTGRHTGSRETDNQRDRQTGRQRDRHTDRHAGRQADRQPDRQTDREADFLGGKVMLLGGDFRDVVPRAIQSVVMDTCFNP